MASLEEDEENICQPEVEVNRWKCNENDCEKIFKHRKSLINHQRQYHLKDENLKCASCDKRFSSKANLNVHERIHSGRLPCTCQVEGCTQSFRTAHFLKEHMKKYHPNLVEEPNSKAQECPYCHQMLSSEKSKRAHVERHLVKNRILCLICNKEFYSLETFNRHMQRMHTGEKGKATEKLLNSNKCPFCTKRFITKREVRDHCLLSHKEFEGLPCQVCGKHFISVVALQAHTKSHKNIEVPRFQCTECSARFTTSSHYNEHLKRHAKSFSHKCPVCPQGFFRQQKLDVHLNRFHRPTIDLRTERSRLRDAAKHRELMPELYPLKKRKEGTNKVSEQLEIQNHNKGDEIKLDPLKLKYLAECTSVDYKKESSVNMKPTVELRNQIDVNHRDFNKENQNQSGNSKINRSEFENTFLHVSSFPAFNWSLLKSKSEKNSPSLKSSENVSSASAKKEGTSHQGNRYEGTSHQGNRYEGTSHQGNRYEGTSHQGKRYEGTSHQGNRYEGTSHQGNRYEGTSHQGNRYEGTSHQGNRYEGTYPQGNRYEGTSRQ